MPRTYLIILLGIIELIILTMLGLFFYSENNKDKLVNPSEENQARHESEALVETPKERQQEKESDAKGTVNECKKSGCSGERCTDEENAYSTCEWRPEYACYKTAECKRQSDGQCGFTETEELAGCLEKK